MPAPAERLARRAAARGLVALDGGRRFLL